MTILSNSGGVKAALYVWEIEGYWFLQTLQRNGSNIHLMKRSVPLCNMKESISPFWLKDCTVSECNEVKKKTVLGQKDPLPRGRKVTKRGGTAGTKEEKTKGGKAEERKGNC